MVLKATKAVTVVEFSKLNVPASAATGSPPVAIGAESDHVRAALEQPEACQAAEVAASARMA
jgi:hypothetical protein